MTPMITNNLKHEITLYIEGNKSYAVLVVLSSH